MPYVVLAVAGFVVALLFASEGSGASARTLHLEPKGKKILFLGDSLSVSKGSAGGQLVELLRAAGATVTVNALGGRSANSFLAGSLKLHEPEKGADQIEAELRDGPDTAIIFLGTNDIAGLAKKSSLKRTKASFQAIVDQLREGGVDVWGIGPPHFPERPDFYPFEADLNKALSAVYGADRYLDAGPLTGNYHMHAGGSSARNFAARLFAGLTGAK